MYNSVIIIFCVFAVYGAYAILRELASLFLRKNKIFAAIHIEKGSESKLNDAILLAESCTQKYGFFYARPVILCDEENKDLQKYGYDVYIKQSGKESYDRGE